VILPFAGGERTSATRWAAAIYKLPAVLADAAIVFLLVLLLAPRIGRTASVVVAAVYAALPAVVYNSAVWGQVDAILALLLVLSLEAARRGRIRWMLAAGTLAMLTKAQAVMLAPVWLAATVCWAVQDWRRWAEAIGIVAIVVIVVLAPFIGALDGVWESYAGASGYYPFTHLNGFSAWFLGDALDRPHLEGNIAAWYARDDAPAFLGITPRTWGLVGAGCVGAFVLVVLWRRRCDETALAWAARVLPLAFFVLSTQMHERYLFPAIAIWAWAAWRSRRWWVGWLLLGVCGSVNILWAWPGPSDAVWVSQARHLLYSHWLGLPCGVWCGAILLLIFAAALAGWFDDGFTFRRRPGAARSAPETAANS
jgi:hypothetical protein